MTPDDPELVEVTPLPGCVAGAVVWRQRGQLQVTVVVKAAFAFAPEAEMTVVDPQELIRADVHLGDDPARSARLTSDLGPLLPRADVLFTGDAHALDGPVRSLPLRLAVLAEGHVLLDKRIVARDKARFTTMPIVYERASTGSDPSENPAGVTALAATVVGLVDPTRPAGFGPIPGAWPARQRRLGPTPPQALEGPIAEIPDAFDWSYFQAAPIDQQIEVLRGDEWIVLEGLHRSLPRLRTRLPGARGAARIHGLAAFGVPEGQRLELRADTLRIDGDQERCSLVFRQSFPIPDEAALAEASIVAGVERAGAPTAWPAPPPERRRPVPPAPRLLAGPLAALRSAPVPSRDPTLTLGGDEEGSAPTRRMVLPFMRGQSSAAVEEGGSAQPSHPHAPRPRTSTGDGGSRASRPAAASDAPSTAVSGETLEMRPGQHALAGSGPALPFRAPPATPAPSFDPEPALFATTLAIATGGASAPDAVLPFASEPAPAAPAPGGPLDAGRTPAAPVPGAPWSAARASRAPEPFGSATLDLRPAPSRQVEPAPAEHRVAAVSTKAPARDPPAQRVVPVHDGGSAGSAPKPPVAPAAAPPAPAKPLGVEEYAAIAAEIAELHVSRREVLHAHGLSEARWAQVEREQTQALANELRRGEHALADAYDDAYVAAWEARRGPLDVGDYAQLTLATERGALGPVLEALSIQRTLWSRLKRVYGRRMAADPAFAAGVHKATEEQRAGGAAGPS
jgi:hypothetical protein